MPEPIARFFRRGGAFTLALALSVLALLAWLGASSWSGTVPRAVTAKAKAAKRRPDPPSNQELAVVLTRLGLDAPSLAAAGLSAQDVTALVGRVRTHLQDHMQDLRSADVACGTASDQVRNLSSWVQSGHSSQEDRAALDAAQTSFNSALATRQTVLNAVLTAADTSVAEGPVAAINTMHVNQTHWDLPTQYLAGSHSEADWVNLRDALDNDSISHRRGFDPDPAAHQLIVSALAEPAVATANTNLQSNLAAVTAAWNSAVFQ